MGLFFRDAFRVSREQRGMSEWSDKIKRVEMFLIGGVQTWRVLLPDKNLISVLRRLHTQTERESGT